MGISRRDFLMRVGQAGGYGAAFTTMQSLGLMPMKGVMAQPIRAAAGAGKGTKVVVLGAGIGGLVSAYELRKLGYDVTLLEARERPGGRNWTGRGGTKVEFVDGTVQTINWEEGNYQNLGPARLPSTHWTMLGYARELGVPMEVEINTTRSSLLQNDKANGGKPVVQRKAINDTRGHVSELLAKCISHGALDAEITKEDRERMMTFLGIYGPLDKDGKYKGSDRAGYKVYPGAGDQVPVNEEPMDMHMLLDESFWNGMLYEEANDWQATMMQPVGGMDQIPYAFAKSLGTIVQYSSPVTQIRKTAKGVSVMYMQAGVEKKIDADYCICAMPFSILKKTPNDFSPAFKAVIDGSTMGHSLKIPWESRRFWEQDYNIYGGLSFVGQGPSPVWYPSSRLMHPTGIVVAGYMDESQVAGFSDMTMEEKFAASRATIEKLHPGHSKELKNPVYCGWRMVKWNEGSWIRDYGGGKQGYETVIEADGPIYFAGDTISHIVGWQEGAALSARRAVDMISEKVKAARLAGGGSVFSGLTAGLRASGYPSVDDLRPFVRWPTYWSRLSGIGALTMNSASSFPSDTGIEVIDLSNDDEFLGRRLHVRDPSAQLEGLQRLARAFVERPETVLQELVESAVSLCGADSAGISVERPNKTASDYYHWIATAGDYAGFLNAVLPQYPSACGICLERGRPQVFRVSQRFFDLMGIKAATVTDGILLPWQVDGLQGTVWVMAHGREMAFDGEDLKLMQVLAEFAAMGIRQQRHQKLLLDKASAAAAAAMADNLAHKINNPLQSLTNTLYLAAEGHNGEGARAVGRQALDDLQRLSALVKQLLELPIGSKDSFS